MPAKTKTKPKTKLPKRRYNWRPDRPDHRDLIHSAKIGFLPILIDLRSKCPPVVDQGQIGSCTGNALAGALGYLQGLAEKSFQAYSRLFIYYFERLMEGDPGQDGGAQIRDGVKVLHQRGSCFESEWPYKKAGLFRRPINAACRDALPHVIKQYLRVDHSALDNVKAALAEGHPIVFGFTVYESFESDAVAKTGIMPMPQPHESVVGGHAVLAVGYDDEKQHLIVRNSWGATWGDKGYFYMPYAYVTGRLASDFWTIRG